MIRRKNHNKQTQNPHKNYLGLQSLQNPTKANKFNYQVNSFSVENQSVLNKQSLPKNKSNYSNQPTLQNKQSSSHKKKDNSLLRKTYCCEKTNFQPDHEFLHNRPNKYQTRLSSENNMFSYSGCRLESSRSPLKQRSKNQVNQMQRTQEETTRKLDSISFRQKKELMRTNRNSLIETKKVLEEDQLQARYQELWNYNQSIKKHSVNAQSSASQNNMKQILSELSHENMIVNTRSYMSHLIQPERQLRKYSTMKSERNSSINSEVGTKKVTSNVFELNTSQENSRSKNVSPNSRSVYPSQIGAQQRKVTRNYYQHEFPSPNIKIPLKEVSCSEDPDVKLRIVQDFSSKISMRIKQLKASMEEMRINKK